MKKLITILTMLMLVALSIHAQKTYALLAGVSNYRVDSINLPNSTKDVKNLQALFERRGFISVPVTSKNANHDNIVKKLNAIIRLAKPEDKIIFYFSGHGSPGGFVPSDRSFFNYQELVDILKKAKAENVFCFIDACMSGSIKSISANYFGMGNGTPHICFMTASDATEYSMESKLVGHGYFTKSLLKALKGMSDGNSDNAVTLNELFYYVYNDVVARTKNSKNVMHPQLLCHPSMKNIVIIGGH